MKTMIRSKLYFSLVLLMGICFTSFGQSSIDRANQMFDDLAFDKAIPLYEAIVKKEDNIEAKKRLGDCYRLQNNFEEAEYWYSQVADAAGVEPIYKFYYGMALQSNGNCDRAVPYFQQYASLVPGDPRGSRFARDCRNAGQFLQDSMLYEVSAIDINSSNSDFGPAFFGEGIIFSSSRNSTAVVNRIHTWTGDPFYNLFYSSAKGDDFGNPKSLTSKINTKFHDGPVSLTRDQKVIYFTRNEGRDNEGVIRLKIYKADINEYGFYSNITELPFNTDNKPYSVAHPALSADGNMLIFSSDMPNGYGGADLYMSKKSGESWGNPVNLGSTINTAGDEVFPYLNAQGAMFFASTGQGGLGGLDMFLTAPSGSNWTDPANLGYPLNSNKDDFGLIINDQNNLGYFVSNREGGEGNDDIYRVRQVGLTLNGQVVDCGTGAPIGGGDVILTDLMNGEKYNATADAAGKFMFRLAPDRKYEIKASKSSYNNGYTKVSTFGVPAGSSLMAKPCLELIGKDVQQSGPTTLIGRLVDRETGTPISGGTIIVRNTCTNRDVTLTSDASGNFNIDALDKSCVYKVQGSKSGYSIDAKQFTAPDGGPTYVTLRIGSEGLLREFIIYYDLDKYNIRPDAQAVLRECIQYVNVNYPNSTLKLSSHTDSRASDSYNAILSRNRTNSAASWLAKNGVVVSRMDKLSFGESQLVNACRNDVNCDEGDHQQNRRTVIQIVP